MKILSLFTLVSFQTFLDLIIWKTKMKYFYFCVPVKKVNRYPGCQAPKFSSVLYTKLSYRVCHSEEYTVEHEMNETLSWCCCDFGARYPRSTFIMKKSGQDIQHIPVCIPQKKFIHVWNDICLSNWHLPFWQYHSHKNSAQKWEAGLYI